MIVRLVAKRWDKPIDQDFKKIEVEEVKGGRGHLKVTYTYHDGKTEEIFIHDGDHGEGLIINPGATE